MFGRTPEVLLMSLRSAQSVVLFLHMASRFNNYFWDEFKSKSLSSFGRLLSGCKC